MPKPVSILFICPYPTDESPSQRFRFEQYFAILHQYNYVVTIQSFFAAGQWKIFYGPGRIFKKVYLLITGFLKRGTVLFQIGKYDFVFIHREAAPIGLPGFEWLVAKVFRKKIIYDFDDAIWTTDRTSEPRLVRWLKCRSKVARICSWAYRVSCGNEFLCAFARRHNPAVIRNPSTIDLSHHTPGRSNTPDGHITIGWTGSHSTLKYLTDVVPALSNLLREFPGCNFVVIADRRPDINLPRLKFVPWNRRSEVTDLHGIHIGIMPLPDDEWSKGKCGFKALQYMAIGVPAVASPVGVNKEIIQDEVNGYLCATSEDWEQSLRKLITDPALRERMGAAGRDLVARHYSVESNTATFLSLFAS